MAFKNFKLETDTDGIALVTWDIPGRSMNVLDETTITELEAIVKQTSADAAVKGVVITSGKEAFSAGADLTLSCHYRVAAENPKTRLGLPEVKVGLFPGAGGTQRVPRIVPPQDAMQL